MIRFASLRSLLCCFKSKQMKILEKGEARIGERLDVVRLYKQLVMVDEAVKALFSRKQIKIAAKSRVLTLDSSASDNGSQESDTGLQDGVSDDHVPVKEEITEHLVQCIFDKGGGTQGKQTVQVPLTTLDVTNMEAPIDSENNRVGLSHELPAILKPQRLSIVDIYQEDDEHGDKQVATR